MGLDTGLDHVFEASVRSKDVYTGVGDEAVPSGKMEIQVATPASPPHSSTLTASCVLLASEYRSCMKRLLISYDQKLRRQALSQSTHLSTKI